MPRHGATFPCSTAPSFPLFVLSKEKSIPVSRHPEYRLLQALDTTDGSQTMGRGPSPLAEPGVREGRRHLRVKNPSHGTSDLLRPSALGALYEYLPPLTGIGCREIPWNRGCSIAGLNIRSSISMTSAPSTTRSRRDNLHEIIFEAETPVGEGLDVFPLIAMAVSIGGACLSVSPRVKLAQDRCFVRRSWARARSRLVTVPA